MMIVVQMNEQAAQFRKLLEKGTVVMPGAFHAFSALLIEKSGFQACYISGAALANVVFGLPDIGLLTLLESSEHARRITKAITIPAIADVDTGFNDVAQTVRAFENANVAGIHIEDQHVDKKCGHLEGKKLISQEAMSEKIRVASKAKSDAHFLIMARTDARAVEGLDRAIERAKAYVKAGADAIFSEALTSIDDFKAFRKAIDVPLLANMTEFGKTPYITVEEFRNIGYNMVIFPMTLLRVASHAMEEALSELKAKGTQKDFVDRMQTREELYRLLKYTP